MEPVFAGLPVDPTTLFDGAMDGSIRDVPGALVRRQSAVVCDSAETGNGDGVRTKGPIGKQFAADSSS